MISVIFPVHNEEPWLTKFLDVVIADLTPQPEPIEIIVVENGSRDRSRERLMDACARHPETVRSLSFPWADYGRALREGFAQARGRIVFAVDLDNWDAAFFNKAMLLLSGRADLVVGCKTAPLDRRGWLRQLATSAHQRLISILFPSLGPLDTHGSIAFRAGPLAGLLAECSANGDFFKLELMVRAAGRGLVIRTISVETRELRPARTSFAVRLLQYLASLPRLWLTLRGWRGGRSA